MFALDDELVRTLFRSLRSLGSCGLDVSASSHLSPTISAFETKAMARGGTTGASC